jgi:hypothetical protein
VGGSLDLSRNGPGGDASGPSAYAGGGVGFGDDDDPFADDVPQGALELDIPSHHTANTSRSLPVNESPRAPAAPPASGSVPDLELRSGPQAKPPRSDPALPLPPRSDPALPPRSDPALASEPSLPPSQPQMRVPAPPSSGSLLSDPSAMIARYPAPPSKIWESPLYTMKVLWRQFELRQDLATLRKRRSPDVALYERALKTHDPKMFAVGMAITCAALVIASFVFFLPVILRFLHDPS